MDKNDFINLKNALCKDDAPYDDITRIHHRESIKMHRTIKIKKFFRDYANLDLDIIENSEETTWEKAIRLAVFVATNIPHHNSWIGINRLNAIKIWKAAPKEGVNCRCHAILLSELLLAVGIKNSFVTCLPFDKNDTDCHVVNHIWLPETNSWAMIDSDMTEYVVDENDKPLSLREMREFIRNDREFYIRSLPGFEDAWMTTDEGKYYWAKNLCYQNIKFHS